VRCLREIWARLTSPEHLSIAVDFGGVTFTADGHQTFVLTAFVQFLQQLKDAEAEVTEAETHMQALPHFRRKPTGMH
jgi:hypothetical protein